MHRNLTWLAALLFAVPAFAVTIEQKLPDAAQEKVAEQVIGQLKCVVCEGQALADSDADFARQIRHEIRRMAGSGQSADTILAYFRNHYGDRILLNPPMEASTVLLWAGPLLMVLVGMLVLHRSTRRAK